LDYTYDQKWPYIKPTINKPSEGKRKGLIGIEDNLIQTDPGDPR